MEDGIDKIAFFLLNPGVLKKRCTKYDNAYNNIILSRFPQLCPERAVDSVAPESEQQTVPSNKLMFSDKKCFVLSYA